MRALAAVLLSLASATAIGTAASAKSVSASVHVFLSVAKVVTVHAPALVRLDAAGKPIVTTGSFFPDLTPDEISAVTLTIAPDDGKKGSDVATINF